MKKPEVEVIKLDGYEIMAGESTCPSHNEYCEGNCAPVSGQCTECQNDCIPLD